MVPKVFGSAILELGCDRFRYRFRERSVLAEARLCDVLIEQEGFIILPRIVEQYDIVRNELLGGEVGPSGAPQGTISASSDGVLRQSMNTIVVPWGECAEAESPPRVPVSWRWVVVHFVWDLCTLSRPELETILGEDARAV